MTPAAGHETGTLVNALIAHCGASLSGIGGVKRPGIVHRLDKDTTGLMVAAKERPGAQIADRAIRRPWPRRRDAARLHGVGMGRAHSPARNHDAPIDRHPFAREKMAVRDGGREAVTHWEVRRPLTGAAGNRSRRCWPAS